MRDEVPTLRHWLYSDFVQESYSAVVSTARGLGRHIVCLRQMAKTADGGGPGGRRERLRTMKLDGLNPN